MKKTFVFLVSASLISLTASAAYTPAPKPGTAVSKPYTFVVEHSEFSGSTSRFAIDLTGAGRKDILAAVSTDGGNAGKNYFVFLQTDAAFKFAGRIFLHAEGFQVLKTKHAGVFDIAAYIRNGSDKGELVRYEFDGTQFNEKSKNEIKSSEFEKTVHLTKVSEIEAPAGVAW